ncbi:MAG: hypothetical protein KJO07_21905, partial [Deltaproteobacteria bacterium]|nr:hypothetical protein [Deltaproteobacteria bacterium]
MVQLRALFIGAVVASAACGGSEEGPTAPLDYNDPATCNPLGTVNCLMPWPSAVYLEEDGSTATGVRVAVPQGAMPTNIDQIVVDPTPLNRYDGFGPTGVIIAGFETGASDSNLPGPENIDASLAPDSPIVVLDMATGERIPFFAETDSTTDEPSEKSLLIRPMVRMPAGARIAVGIRNSVKAYDGSDLARPAGFQALIDDKSYSHPLFSKIEGRYPEIFDALEGAGVPRDELVLAWDFVVASDDFLTRDLLTMRDASLPAIGEAGANLSYQLEEGSTRPDYVSNIYVGTHTAPNFLTNGEADKSRLIRDDDGLPVLSGDYEANFAAIIPNCMAEAE